MRKSAAGWARASKRGMPMPSFRSRRRPVVQRVTLSGTSEGEHSTTIFCDVRARGLSLVTSMPCAGSRQHDGASTRSPLISTMHARQLPSGRVPSCSTGAGWRRRVARRLDDRSPGRPRLLPLSLNSTVAVRASCLVLYGDGVYGLSSNSCGKYLITQRPDWRGLPQSADRGVIMACESSASKGWFHLAMAISAHRLRRADAAGRALAAGFLVEETHQVSAASRALSCCGKDDHRRGTDEASMRLQRIEVQRNIAQRCRKDSARRAAGQVAVERVSRRACRRNTRRSARAP